MRSRLLDQLQQHNQKDKGHDRDDYKDSLAPFFLLKQTQAKRAIVAAFLMFVAQDEPPDWTPQQDAPPAGPGLDLESGIFARDRTTALAANDMISSAKRRSAGAQIIVREWVVFGCHGQSLQGR